MDGLFLESPEMRADPLGADLDDMVDSVAKLLILAARGNAYAIHALSSAVYNPDFGHSEKAFRQAFAATRRERERIKS